MKKSSYAAPITREEKWMLRSVIHGFLSMNREPAFFHGPGKVERYMDVILLIRITGQDSNRCAGEEALQISFYHTPWIIEESDNLFHFPDRQCDAWIRSVHEKGMPAGALEVQTT